MNQADHKDAGLERLILFSDAVFAIAITLLIIDIRIPFREDMSNRLLLSLLGERLPELFGFIISFFVIGGFWVLHHKMFGHVRRGDQRLLWLNLFFLLFIVLLPFSTSVFGVYGNLAVATTLYTLNVLLAGLMNFWCMRHILHSPGMAQGLEDRQERRLAYARILAIPAWMVFCWALGLLTSPGLGDLLLFGLAGIMPLTRRLFGPRPLRRPTVPPAADP